MQVIRLGFLLMLESIMALAMGFVPQVVGDQSEGEKSSAATGSLFARPVLPVEGEEITLTYRRPPRSLSGGNSSTRFRISGPRKESCLEKDIALVNKGDTQESSLSWSPPRNGLYRVEATAEGKDSSGSQPARLDLPVIAKGRPLDFVWYGYSPGVRWATVVASSTKEQAPLLRESGIKALAWSWGSNHPAVAEKPIGQLSEEAERFYKVPEGFGYDGYGMDEFGGYPQTDSEARGLAWLRGLIKARKQFPKDFVVAAWHAGGVRDEWVGLYKQAADLLLLEAYDLYYVPKELGAENIYENLRGRLRAVRGADLFTRAYGFPCKALVALDLVGDKGKRLFDAGELEQVVRFLRREFPEMRGLAFFNSGIDEATARLADQLCFDYYIKPVLAFQPNSLWLDQLEGRSQLVAAPSNLGGMDSGPVTVRFKVNGKVLGAKQIDSVPAGDSRLSNRALVRLEWKPKHSGYHEFQVELDSASGSTVLDARLTERRWVTREGTQQSGGNAP